MTMHINTDSVQFSRTSVVPQLSCPPRVEKQTKKHGICFDLINSIVEKQCMKKRGKFGSFLTKNKLMDDKN